MCDQSGKGMRSLGFETWIAIQLGVAIRLETSWPPPVSCLIVGVPACGSFSPSPDCCLGCSSVHILAWHFQGRIPMVGLAVAEACQLKSLFLFSFCLSQCSFLFFFLSLSLSFTCPLTCTCLIFAGASRILMYAGSLWTFHLLEYAASCSLLSVCRSVGMSCNVCLWVSIS